MLKRVIFYLSLKSLVYFIIRQFLILHASKNIVFFYYFKVSFLTTKMMSAAAKCLVTDDLGVGFCCLCTTPMLLMFGHNAQPLFSGVCCDDCNQKLVVFYRFKLMGADFKEERVLTAQQQNVDEVYAFVAEQTLKINKLHSTCLPKSLDYWDYVVFESKHMKVNCFELKLKKTAQEEYKLPSIRLSKGSKGLVPNFDLEGSFELIEGDNSDNDYELQFDFEGENNKENIMISTTEHKNF